MSLARFKAAVVTATAEESIESAARTMRDRSVGCLVVLREGRPVGILTDRDLVVRAMAEGRDPASSRVGEFVTYAPIVAHVDESIETVVDRMRVHGVRRMPIVDDRGGAVGIVTSDDLLVLLGRELAGMASGIEERADACDSR